MTNELSPNTKAILLLTAPLIAGRGKVSADPLSAGEYKRLARRLRECRRQPFDLLGPGAGEVLKECRLDLDGTRLERLLERGFLLSHAVERWQARAIWVLSRADTEYPQRLKKRLGEEAPPVLYGCGDAAILSKGGLAVVGSRRVDDALIEYTESVGRLTADARRTLVSGGARGIDQAAMRGALEEGGEVAGVLADGLERAAMTREHRDVLMNGRLVLVSPYDPAAQFHVGHAMQRNKLIYALADVALVVSSDCGKGGTWAGAIEQLDKLRFVTVYTRSNGELGEGLETLRRKGARAWPNPRTPEEFGKVLDVHAPLEAGASPQASLFSRTEEGPEAYGVKEATHPGSSPAVEVSPAEELFVKVRELLKRLDTPKTDSEVAEELQVTKSQARDWLRRLVAEGVLKKLSRPVRYRSTSSSLFDGRDKDVKGGDT